MQTAVLAILEFRVLGGGQNIFDFRDGRPEVRVIFRRGRSIHSSSIFLFLNAKFQFQSSHFQI